MPLALFSAAFACLLSVLLTPLFREFALRAGWVNKPDHNRKVHPVPVPRIGGVPIILASAGSVAAVLFVSRQGSAPVQHLPLLWKLLPAIAVVFLTGLLDDLVGLKPRHKLVGQTLAAAAAWLAGVRIGGLDTEWSAVLTVLWLVGCTNAFNLIDGCDGVATGVGLFATITTGIAALLHGDTGLMMATAPLAGALCGFLWFNFNPASIFLGDSGSLWLGFMLGCYAVIWSQKSATLLGMSAPVIALSVPLLDTGLSIVRRFLRSEPIFRPDQGHIHHRLLARGLTPRRVALLLYGASGVAACFSLLQSTLRAEGLVIVLVCGSAWFGIQYLGYREFGVAARLLHRDFRSMVRAEMLMDGFEKSLRAAGTADECWKVIRAAGRDLGFCAVSLRINGSHYHEQLQTNVNGHWDLRIPLSESEYVLLTHQVESSAAPSLLIPFTNLIYRTLSPKAAQFPHRTAA